MKILRFLFIITFLLVNDLYAQDWKINSSNYKERSSAIISQKKLLDQSIAKEIEFKSIGPSIMSGRVVDIEVNPMDPTKFYVAYASGGLWKTENNGITFTPLFDKEESMTIGDFAVDWLHHETLWVGTGENNSSRSSYAGTGIFKSSDGGKHWTKKGLEESQHIGSVIIDPLDTNTIYVGVIGNLFSFSQERGVFKTIDGGKTWKNCLFIKENTGCIDLKMDPKNSQILYASFWERERKAWDFKEAGKNSGIYKSTDAGKNWKLISTKENGFPITDGSGRIGLSIYEKNPQIIYAIIDNQDPQPEKKKTEDKLLKADLRKMLKEDFLKLDENKLTAFLKENNFPEKYTQSIIKEKIKKEEIKPIQLVEYLEDANALLFDRDIIGPEIYKSINGGTTWSKQNKELIEETFFSYGYYFGRLWVSPSDENKVYVSGLFPLKSNNGGQTFERMINGNVHADHHALWINPNKEGHLINGNDGGVNISYDDGKTWFKANTPAVGQFYSVNYDMEKPYNVYGGLQDNGVWTGSSQSNPDNFDWLQEGKNNFKMIMGGDGMQVKIDYRDNKTVYSGYQFGNYFRINKESGDAKFITPKHDLGERPFRWNWQAPIFVSSHNADIIYMGSNRFHRSMDKGENFKNFNQDLTKGGIKGDVPYGTLTQIEESPLRFGLIYVGSDDGIIHVSKDVGNTWTKISDKLPQNFWVRKIAVSNFSEGRVYICLNGHTFDHFKSYLFVSNNFGETWEAIGTDLPFEPINVVKEDPINENLLFIGTDHGVYFSLDRGKNFMKMEKNLPAVPVHDLVIHPRDHDLILGTHGRSIYIAGIGNLEKMVDSNLTKDFTVLESNYEIKYNKNWGKKYSQWAKLDTSNWNFHFYSKFNNKLIVKVKTDSGSTVYSKEINGTYGLNTFEYNLSVDSNLIPAYINSISYNSKEKIEIKLADNKLYYLLPGNYKLIFELEGKILGEEKFLIVDKEKSKKQARTLQSSELE